MLSLLKINTVDSERTFVLLSEYFINVIPYHSVNIGYVIQM
jgi:hypothetical protein